MIEVDDSRRETSNIDVNVVYKHEIEKIGIDKFISRLIKHFHISRSFTGSFTNIFSLISRNYLLFCFQALFLLLLGKYFNFLSVSVFLMPKFMVLWKQYTRFKICFRNFLLGEKFFQNGQLSNCLLYEFCILKKPILRYFLSVKSITRFDSGQP